jgi:glycosyl transferase family 25
MAVSLGIFAINLDRSPDRWERISSQFSRQPWPLHRVVAIDGRDSDTTLAYRGLTAARPDGVGWSITRLRLVSFAEEACFCSHLKALREFLASDYSHAMILEDDARIVGDLSPVVAVVGDVCRGETVLKVSGSPRTGSRLARFVKQAGTFRIVRSFEPASNATAYIVSKSTALKLLDKAERILAPFDDYLSAPGLHGCSVLHVSPWAITNKWPKKDVPSTLAEGRTSMARKRGPVSWILQRFLRARLRLSLWRNTLWSKGRPILAPWSV